MEIMYLIKAIFYPRNPFDYPQNCGIVATEKRAEEIIIELQNLPNYNSNIIYTVEEIEILT